MALVDQVLADEARGDRHGGGTFVIDWLLGLTRRTLTDVCVPQNCEKFKECFETYCASTLFWMLITVLQVVPLEDMNKIQSLLYMLDVTMTGNMLSTPEAVEMGFVYCTIWAMGSSLTVADDGTDYK